MKKNSVFSIFPKMSFAIRAIIVVLFIMIGFYLQFLNVSNFLGVIFIVMGSILLCYKNVVVKNDSNAFSHSTEWQKVSEENIRSIVDMQKKIKKWKKSAIPGGCLVGVVFFMVLYLILFYIDVESGTFVLVTIDFVALFIPLFIGGKKEASLLELPVRYASESLRIADMLKKNNPQINIIYNVLLATNKNNEKAIPKEVKLQFESPNSPDSLIGLYGQLSFNKIGAVTYTYFYTTMVFKEDFKCIDRINEKMIDKKTMVLELEKKDRVEVVIIRQKTTSNSGYETKNNAIKNIFTKSIDILNSIEK